MAAKPESVGMSSARLARLEAYLAERYIDPGLLPCAMTMVHRRGELVHWGVQGKADVERGKPLEEDTIFAIYSMTKPVAAVALLMLFEECRLQLDDPVHRYIPEWRDLGVAIGGGAGVPFKTRPPARPMQIVDLLRHTSGLTYGIQQRTNVDAAYRDKKIGITVGAGSLGDMIQNLARLPLEFSPGEAWNYSVSTDVVGYLVGKISGMPFEQFLHERIFAPLGMVDTDFFVPPEKAHRLAAIYRPGSGKLVLQYDPAKSFLLNPPDMHSGGAGLVSTASDYLKFCRMLINGGELDGVRLLSPLSVELMTANHLPGGVTLAAMSQSLFSEAAYAGTGFGLGVAVTVDPVASLLPGSPGEFYWGGMASTAFWVDPEEDLIVVFMTQLIPSSFYNIRRELRTLVYSAIIE